MKIKSNWDLLPNVIIEKNIIPYLTKPDLINLAVSSTRENYCMLFKPALDVCRLLHHVVNGEHQKVSSLLKWKINLLVKKGSVTDCSGRSFENISAFEYALWALDKHMWTLMLDCLIQVGTCGQLLLDLLNQYNKLRTEGLTYTLQGKLITEQNFDFQNTIIKELQKQVDSLNAPGRKEWDDIDAQWVNGVGGAQRLFPMHVVFEYCSEEFFHPVPKFVFNPVEKTLDSRNIDLSSSGYSFDFVPPPRLPKLKALKQFYNSETGFYENWFSSNSKLGVDFAIVKRTGVLSPLCGAIAAPSAMGSWRPGLSDLDAMKALYEIRVLDLIKLQTKLEELLAIEKQLLFQNY